MSVVDIWEVSPENARNPKPLNPKRPKAETLLRQVSPLSEARCTLSDLAQIRRPGGDLEEDKLFGVLQGPYEDI